MSTRRSRRRWRCACGRWSRGTGRWSWRTGTSTGRTSSTTRSRCGASTRRRRWRRTSVAGPSTTATCAPWRGGWRSSTLRRPCCPRPIRSVTCSARATTTPPSCWRSPTTRRHRGSYAAKRFTAAFLVAHRDELVARAADGRVRDGHGDLRAEHVVLRPAGAPPLVVDRLEFDARLREIDVADDLAFLVMDLESLGAAGTRAARTLVAAYREAGGDPGSDALIAFYGTYRALVRAKVHLLRAAQLDDPAAAGAAREQARALLRPRRAPRVARPRAARAGRGRPAGEREVDARSGAGALQRLAGAVVRRRAQGAARARSGAARAAGRLRAGRARRGLPRAGRACWASGCGRRRRRGDRRRDVRRRGAARVVPRRARRRRRRGRRRGGCAAGARMPGAGRAAPALGARAQCRHRPRLGRHPRRRPAARRRPQRLGRVAGGGEAPDRQARRRRGCGRRPGGRVGGRGPAGGSPRAAV